MTFTEQAKFIKELIANVQDDILWDGIEIRWRIADVFGEVVFGDVGKREGKLTEPSRASPP